MNEDEIKEYEELCKRKNLKDNDNNTNILMDIDLNINGEKGNNIDNSNNEKMKVDNEFIDIREILSEEKFNEVKQDYFLDDLK